MIYCMLMAHVLIAHSVQSSKKKCITKILLKAHDSTPANSLLSYYPQIELYTNPPG